MEGNWKMVGLILHTHILYRQMGTMLYHPTHDKIGQPIENTVIKGRSIRTCNVGKKPQMQLWNMIIGGCQRMQDMQLTSNKDCSHHSG